MAMLSRARRALEAGCDGVVSLGLEKLRADVPETLATVSPGMRSADNTAPLRGTITTA